MNLWGPTIVLYVLAGIGVAGALYLSNLARTPRERAFQMATAVAFWPLYLPLLLARTPTVPSEQPPAVPIREELTAAIAQADAELAAALAGLDGWTTEELQPSAPGLRVLAALDGWAKGVLSREQDRIRELRRAWNAQAQRIREMDKVLAAAASEEPAPASDGEGSNSDRFYRSREARLENLQRLREVREQTYRELMGSLDWVREVVSRIHLAKFTGAPPSRAEELIGQIAAAIEGLSASSTPEPSPPRLASGSQPRA